MKKLVFLILLFISAQVVFSQTFNFYRISNPIVYGDTALYTVTATKAIFKNTSSDSLNFTFARVVNILPGPSWYSSLCVGSSCYSNTVDTIPPRNSPAIKLGPNQQDTMIIDVSGNTIGTAKIVMQCWVNSNPANYKIDTFRVYLGPVGIQNISTTIENYNLEQNYPNPFNPITKINFSIFKTDFVTLKVYDILGNEVASLLNQEQLAGGKYSYTFNSADYNLSSGLYFYTLQTKQFTSTKKMLLIK